MNTPGVVNNDYQIIWWFVASKILDISHKLWNGIKEVCQEFGKVAFLRYAHDNQQHSLLPGSSIGGTNLILQSAISMEKIQPRNNPCYNYYIPLKHGIFNFLIMLINK